MITPVELEGKVFKSGLGYDKKEVDGFLQSLLEDYETLYTSNVDFKEKISELEEKLTYYKSIEKTLQRALVLAEKTAENTKEVAEKEASILVDEARLEADTIIKDSKNEVEKIRKQSVDLIQQYEVYKAQFRQIARAQMELLESEAFEIQIAKVSEAINKDKEATSNESLKIDSEGKEETELDNMKKVEAVDSDSLKNDYDIEFFNLNDDE